MIKYGSKYDYPDTSSSMDLQTGFVCRIWH